MNAKDFLDLMGEIDGDLIVNAKEPVAPRRAPAWRKLTVIAAAACLLVGVLSALVLIGMQQNVDDELPQDTESVIESPEEDAQPEQGETVVEAETLEETLEETTTPTPNIAIGAFLENLNALQYGSSESVGLSVNHRQEISLTSREYTDSSVAQMVTITISDQTYELLYQNSESGPHYNDAIHKYEAGSIKQWFNAETGKCVFFMMPATKPENEEDACTKEEQLEIAKEFLNSQVDDPENYQITKEEWTTSGVLFVYFNRKVSDIITSDNVRVSIDRAGIIRAYRMDHVGELRDVQHIPDELLQKVYNELDNEAKRIYGCLEDQGYTWTNENSIEGLSRLDDGSLALKCYVSATITAPDGMILSDGAWFIIPITEPTIQTE